VNADTGSPALRLGWPVCFVTREQIIDDSDMTGLTSAEPTVYDWLRFIMEDDLELI
jgi:hypothetical protein